MEKLILLSLFLSSWSKFYGDTQYVEQRGIKNKRLTDQLSKETKGLYIVQCSFSNLNLEKNAGAAIYTDINSDILIEECLFSNCQTKTDCAGAIDIQTTGNCVISRVCGTKCQSPIYLMFGRVNVSSNGRNEVYQSTFSNCRSEGDVIKAGIIEFNNGIIKNNEVNGSKCLVSYNILFLISFKDEKATTSTISYSTFADNEFGISTCINFDTLDSYNLIKRCNIIRNKHISDNGDGVIYAWGANLVVEDTCIAQNKAECLIDVRSCTIGNEATTKYIGSIILRNCYLDRTDAKAVNNDQNEKEIVKEDIPKESFINNLIGYQKGECKASYDILRDIFCYKKDLSNPTSKIGLFGMALTILILPKETIPINSPTK